MARSFADIAFTPGVRDFQTTMGSRRNYAALDAAKQRSQIVVFPDAPHGFHADYRPSFRADVAKDAWGQCLSWFRKNGVG